MTSHEHNIENYVNINMMPSNKPASCPQSENTALNKIQPYEA